jgi:hypothetical protein
VKKLLFFGLLFLPGCYEHIPNGIIAQMAVERFLDTVYMPGKVEDITGINEITTQDYLIPSKLKKFQSEFSASEWILSTKRIQSILSKKPNGMIQIEGYSVKGKKYKMVFLVDSSFRRVMPIMPLNTN